MMRSSSTRTLWPVVTMGFLTLGTYGQGAVELVSAKPPVRHLTITRVDSKIDIDGRLDETAWNSATAIDVPYEWFPGENIEAPVATECLLMYDDRALYVGFRAHDPEPHKIRAHLMDRDQIDTLIQDDFVGFLIDTFNDQRSAFQFRVNPLGVQAEALNTLVSEDWEWDVIWESAGQINEEGYAVEIAVPFQQLRFPASEEGLTFGFEAMRSWPRGVRHRMTSHYTDYGDSCLMCQFDKVSGFLGMDPGRNVEIDPTFTASRTDRREDFPGGGLEKGDVDVDPGLSARWGVTTNLSLNGAVNPDFSQVEADVPQLEVNERFALFFPEKRPFFLEGVDYFQTPKQVVFTRTVADPAWGAKLTGKAGDNALGIFVTRDRINNFVIPSNQFSTFESVEQDVTGSVLRYRRDVGRASTVGVLYTGREATDYHNRVAAVDAVVEVASADRIELQYIHSDTLYSGEVSGRHDQSSGAFGGDGLFVEYSHQTRSWSWAATYEDLTPGLRADSGFIPRVDTRKVEAWMAHVWWGDPGDWWTSFDLGPGYTRIVDHDGTLTNETAEFGGALDGPLQSRLLFRLGLGKEYFDGETFGVNQAYFTFQIQPTGSMKLVLEGDFGDRIDSFNTQEGNLRSWSPGAELKLGRHINLNLRHSYQRLDVEGGTLYRENLSDARLFYHFDTTKLFRVTLQYRSVRRDTALFSAPVDPELRSLNLQLLASYKLNPRTVVFVGYSGECLGRADVGLAQTDRTFFIKLGYAVTL